MTAAGRYSGDDDSSDTDASSDEHGAAPAPLPAPTRLQDIHAEHKGLLRMWRKSVAKAIEAEKEMRKLRLEAAELAVGVAVAVAAREQEVTAENGGNEDDAGSCEAWPGASAAIGVEVNRVAGDSEGLDSEVQGSESEAARRKREKNRKKKERKREKKLKQQEALVY